MERKKLSFAAEKCKVLKFGVTKSHSSSLAIGNDNLEVVSNFRYLGDEFDSERSYSVLCKTRAQKSLWVQPLSLFHCAKKSSLGKTDPKYDTPVFLPGLIYNAEAWSIH